MTAEEIYIKLKDELTAENESSSSPERIFIKNEGQTICTIGMNRSHEIIFVEFKPTPKDLDTIEREEFVHPHPVEMLHDAGWRQAQLTSWEEAEKLLEIIHRSYKKKRKPPEERISAPARSRKAAATEGAPNGRARGAAARIAGGTAKKGAERSLQRMPKVAEKVVKAGGTTSAKIDKKATTIPKVKSKPSPRPAAGKAPAPKRPKPAAKQKAVAARKAPAKKKALPKKAKVKAKAPVKTKAKPKKAAKKPAVAKAKAKKRR